MDEENNIRIVSNSEAGNIWAGWIIAQLADAWPMTFSFDWMGIINKTGVWIASKDDEQEAISCLFRWLEREGFIRSNSGEINEYFLEYEITQQTKVMLNMQVPTLISKKFGDALSDAAKDIGKDAAKSQLSDLFGQFIGGIIKSVAS